MLLFYSGIFDLGELKFFYLVGGKDYQMITQMSVKHSIFIDGVLRIFLCKIPVGDPSDILYCDKYLPQAK